MSSKRSLALLLLFLTVQVIESLATRHQKLTHHSKTINSSPFLSRHKRSEQAPPNPRCQNDGIEVDNGRCQCPDYVTGQHCEQIQCQHWSAVDTANGRCVCPAGWAAKFCETRGARPVVTQDVDFRRRSVIFVISSIPAMAEERTILLQNLNQTVFDLQANEPGYLVSFTISLFVGSQDGMLTTLSSTNANFDSIYNFFRDSSMQVANQSAGLQPVIAATQSAINLATESMSHPLVFVFANRGDFNAGNESVQLGGDTNGNDNEEQQLTQTALAWRAKVYFFITQDPNFPTDTTKNNYDVYRRIARNTHGDLFNIPQKNELATVLKSFIPRIYKPEMVSVRSYTTCADLRLPVKRDFTDQKVTMTLSLDSTAGNPVILVTNAVTGGAIMEDATGAAWKIYSIPTATTTVRIVSDTPVSCNVRLFVSSDNSVIFSHADDMNQDAGETYDTAEYTTFLTARATGFTAGIGQFVAQKTSSLDGSVIYATLYGGPRSGDRWTLDYRFPASAKCDPGPASETFSVTAGQTTVQRVYPDYCYRSVDHPAQVQTAVVVNRQQADADTVCPVKNIDALNAPSLHEYRQVMFAIEATSEMNGTIQKLKDVIYQVTNTMINDGFRRQYTLLVFDQNKATAVSSSYNGREFALSIDRLLSDISSNLVAAGGAPVKSLDAIWKAVDLILVSPATLHVFSRSAPNELREEILPSNIQVNWYLLSETGLLPLSETITGIQRATSGRLIALKENDVPTLTNLLLKSVYENNLVLDEAVENCTSGGEFLFYVESGAQRLSITILGSGLAIVGLFDAARNPIAISGANTLFNSTNSIVLSVDVLQSASGAGRWKLLVSTKSGICYTQVRLVSNVNTAVGFLSNIKSDFPATQPYFRRGANHSEYIAIRLSDARNQNIVQTITGFSVIPIDMENPWEEGTPITTTTVVQREDTQCAYQYRMDAIKMPISNMLKTEIQLKDENGNEMRRLFFFYTPLDVGAKNACNGAQVNEFGECQCPAGFEGEFCYDPICQNGGIASAGACGCPRGYTGDSCQLVIRSPTEIGTNPPSQSTLPPSASTAAPVIPTTKPSALTTIIPSILTAVILLVIS